MNRREFAATLAFASTARAERIARRPRLLIAPDDPFGGIPLLRARYAAGRSLPEDGPGFALRWLLTGQDEWAERALAELRTRPLPGIRRPARAWLDYTRAALTFDWLYAYPAFDAGAKDRLAGELAAAGAAMLVLPDLVDPGQVSYHNYALRYLCLAAFTLAAVQNHGNLDVRCNPLREHVSKAFDNILDLTELVTPEGSYHESMDYMRITWTPLALMAELRRTAAGVDPARRFTVFRNFGDTFLYKLLPNGTPSREGDNEYPLTNDYDTTVLGYAVHRFKDPYSAWILRESGFVGSSWALPILAFLWDDPSVQPRDPQLASERELPRHRYFPGVGHLVLRSGWTPESTWIEFDCGPYFAKHQHLDRNHFTIYRNGYLAIDSGADYTDSESPHYLNYYRRTVAHNSVLVYDPAERFFWSENVLEAANDGGQRMDSSRFWNTVRSLEDWKRTRDLWNLGSMRVQDYEPGLYSYALGDATRAYSQSKLRRFTRELLYSPGQDVLVVFDRVRSTEARFRKCWLLHGVNEPVVEGHAVAAGHGWAAFRNAPTFRFFEGAGELLVHSLLPVQRIVTRRGGLDDAFWTPGDARMAVCGERARTGRWSQNMEEICRPARRLSRCGRRSGAKTSTTFKRQTGRTLCRGIGAWRLPLGSPPKKTIFSMQLKSGIAARLEDARWPWLAAVM